MYRSQTGACNYEEMTEDVIDVTKLATMSGKKVYKVKAHVSAAKNRIEIGMAIDQYCDWLRTNDLLSASTPIEKEKIPFVRTIQISENATIEIDSAQTVVVRRNPSDVVNEDVSYGSIKSSRPSQILESVFGLTEEQQKDFWSSDKFMKWKATTKSGLTLNDFQQSLTSI